MTTPVKQRRLLELKRSVDRLTAAMPQLLRLERDLAISMATTRRLLGENDKLREQNLELRRMVSVCRTTK